LHFSRTEDEMRRASGVSQTIPVLTALVAAWLMAAPRTLSPLQAQQASRTITLTGCVVEEGEYASDHGLARTSDRDPAAAQLVFIPDEQSRAAIGAEGTRPVAYVLTGPNEARLARNVHQQVSIDGVVERQFSGGASTSSPSSTSGRLTPDGAAGVTADGSPAHEPADATGGRRLDQRAVQPDGRSASISELDRINVTTARVIGGACGVPRDRIATPAAQASAQARPATAVAQSNRTPSLTTVTGCLVRRDEGSAPAGLTLLVPVSNTRPSRSAVPGSLPSGAGSETIGTSGSAANSSSGIVGYRLTGDTTALARYVGQRVRVEGGEEVVEGNAAVRAASGSEPPSRTEPPAPATAHPSTTLRVFHVATFTPLGGACQ
jgi:hypothetical protein